MLLQLLQLLQQQLLPSKIKGAVDVKGNPTGSLNTNYEWVSVGLKERLVLVGESLAEHCG